MRRPYFALLPLWLLAAAVVACGGSDPAPAPADVAAADVVDATAEDADVAAPDQAADTPDDATPADAAEPDALPDAEPPQDALPDDTAAQGVQTPWGTIEGACKGTIAAELDAPTPSFLVNTYTFAESGPFDPDPLRPGALKRYEGENAGGSSKCSEVMSMQLLFDCEGATTLKTENEITYTGQGNITDWLATFDGVKVGVSVTRAYLGPTTTTYSVEKAQDLLKKKLEGILSSTSLVSEEDKWQKQILHVWTLQPTWVPLLQEAWQGLDATTKADTIVLVTVEQGADSVVKDTCL